jgi:DNA invertase Pin-like site-specific DNA recombinase
MKIGYVYVSASGQNLDLQLNELKKAGAEKVFYDKISDNRDDRPELNRLLQDLRKGDALVVYKLDRLGKPTKKLLELTEEFDLKGIELISIQDQIDTTAEIGKAMFRMLRVLVEMEKNIIAEQTKASLAVEKSRGKVGSRPRKEEKSVEQAINLYESREYFIKEVNNMEVSPKATFYRTLIKFTNVHQDIF